MSGNHARTVRTTVRAVLGVGVAAGAGLVVWASLPPQPAPEPERTFDLRVASTHGTTPAAAARRAPVTRPVRLQIPALGVDAPLEPETVSEGGALVVPGDPGSVGYWHGGGAGDVPARGVTVLAGHVDVDGDLGALHPLSRVTPGTEIRLRGEDGRVETWRVDGLEVRDKDDLPAFPATGPRRLAVVTCGGPVIRTAHGRTYRDNVIAWATPTG